MISVVIPVLNEENTIEAIVQRLKEYEDKIEIIVVDGGSSDSTLDRIGDDWIVARATGGRGAQMNAGASLAKGEILLFLHCDSQLECGFVKEIEKAILVDGADATSFSMKFDKSGLLLSLIAYLSNKRVDIFKVVFGDQGMAISRKKFQELGGFAEIELMEDLEFGIRLRKASKVKRLNMKTTTSARRFEKNGIMRTMMLMHILKIKYFMGTPPKELKKLYMDVRN